MTVLISAEKQRKAFKGQARDTPIRTLLQLSAYEIRQRFPRKVCSRCGFVASHQSQIELDHIDGNRCNNSLKNIQELCANCHNLKTYAPDLFNKNLGSYGDFDYF